MAGVSVQAFRRQGRRFGAGLVCSEMVSACGLSYSNERTLGYLRIARDEHPLAVQVFGSDPGRVAEAARMCEAAGADIIDINMGCPVRKVTKTARAPRCSRSTSRPSRRQERRRRRRRRAGDGQAAARAAQRLARARSSSARRLVEAGAQAITLHPRSAVQMYTGVRRPRADGRAGVARRRPGDRLGRHHEPGAGAGGARQDRRGGGDDRTRRPGQPVAAAGAASRRAARPSRRGARRPSSCASSARSPRAGSGARGRLAAQVLRLVPARRPARQAMRAALATAQTSPRSSGLLLEAGAGAAA